MSIEKFTENASVLFKYSVIAYFFVSFYYFMSLPAGGDETLFLSDLQLINNIGWYDAVAKNVSIPYLILAYPLSYFLGDFVALKTINILLIALLFVYFYYIKNIRSKALYSYLLFFVSTVGYFFFGTNDCLFFVSLIIFFNEVNCAVSSNKVNFNLAFSALIIAFFTRELFLIYLPIVFIGSYILYQSGCRFTKKTFYPLGIFTLLMLLNIPSLQKNGSLSFDRKLPPEGLGVSWSQRQYLAQLMVNSGELTNFQHPSWEQTKVYLEKNGKKSLPNGILKSIAFDWQLTIKEFFKDFGYSILFSFRSLGLMMLITLGYWLRKENNKLGVINFVPFSTLLMLLIFSFIIISYVELRWLSAVFVMTIVCYSDLEYQKSISKYFIFTNYIIVWLFSIYGVFKIFHKM